MTNKEALEILKEYNDWRRGADTEQLPPRVIGQAIDKAIRSLEKNEKTV